MPACQVVELHPTKIKFVHNYNVFVIWMKNFVLLFWNSANNDWYVIMQNRVLSYNLFEKIKTWEISHSCFSFKYNIEKNCFFCRYGICSCHNIAVVAKVAIKHQSINQSKLPSFVKWSISTKYLDLNKHYCSSLKSYLKCWSFCSILIPTSLYKWW
jgi:hypothetical protein